MINRSRLKNLANLTGRFTHLPKLSRSVYIASANRYKKRQPSLPPTHQTHFKDKLDSLTDENKDLETRIKQIQAYTAVLRRYISEKDEIQLKEKIVEEEKLDVDSRVSEKELEVLDKALSLDYDPAISENKSLPDTTSKLDGLGLFAFPASTTSLPSAILSRLGSSVINISSLSSKDQNWSKIITTLLKSEGLKDLSVTDVDLLIKNIPLDQRASNQILPIIHEMMLDAKLQPSKMTLDLTMAAYAHQGQTKLVEAFMTQMKADGYTPDVYTYGHLIKSFAKNGDLKNSSLKLQEMQSLGIKPSLQIYTTILQTCIRVNDFDEAFRVFDLLKYMSLQTQPDVRIYNSLLLAAAKQHNIEKVLDLLKEMTTRPINPLQPNAETYNTLIFACARDERTHLQAWKYLIEMQEKGFQIDRKSINALMYLCGETGEVLLARAMFRQLCTNPVSYPDSFTFNSLLNSYSNYKLGVFSPVMASELGVKIRSSFFLNDNLSFTNPDVSPSMPPFLPTTMLHSYSQVFAESKALLDFFTDYAPSMVNQQVILTYLKIPYKLGNFKEFTTRYKDETFFLPEQHDDVKSRAVPEVVVEEPFDHIHNQTDISVDRSFRAISRNWNTYDLAIKACVVACDMEFAQKVWMERGEYRRTSSFKHLPVKIRNSSDFSFARNMVELHAKCGEIDQALKLIRSTIKQFHWKKYQVAELINKLNEIEDTQSIKELTYLLASYNRTKQVYSEFHDIVNRGQGSKRSSS